MCNSNGFLTKLVYPRFICLCLPFVALTLLMGVSMLSTLVSGGFDEDSSTGDTLVDWIVCGFIIGLGIVCLLCMSCFVVVIIMDIVPTIIATCFMVTELGIAGFGADDMMDVMLNAENDDRNKSERTKHNELVLSTVAYKYSYVSIVGCLVSLGCCISDLILMLVFFYVWPVYFIYCPIYLLLLGMVAMIADLVCLLHCVTIGIGCVRRLSPGGNEP